MACIENGDDVEHPYQVLAEADKGDDPNVFVFGFVSESVAHSNKREKVRGSVAEEPADHLPFRDSLNVSYYAGWIDEVGGVPTRLLLRDTSARTFQGTGSTRGVAYAHERLLRPPMQLGRVDRSRWGSGTPTKAIVWAAVGGVAILLMVGSVVERLYGRPSASGLCFYGFVQR